MTTRTRRCHLRRAGRRVLRHRRDPAAVSVGRLASAALLAGIFGRGGALPRASLRSAPPSSLRLRRGKIAPPDGRGRDGCPASEPDQVAPAGAGEVGERSPVARTPTRPAGLSEPAGGAVERQRDGAGRGESGPRRARPDSPPAAGAAVRPRTSPDRERGEERRRGVEYGDGMSDQVSGREGGYGGMAVRRNTSSQAESCKRQRDEAVSRRYQLWKQATSPEKNGPETLAGPGEPPDTLPRTASPHPRGHPARAPGSPRDTPGKSPSPAGSGTGSA